MAPKKKKLPKNAFCFYMLDWKRWKEAEGHRLSMAEVSQFCAEDWKILPEKERKRYKEMELEAKQKDKTDLSNKFNSLGTSYETIEKQQREIQDAISAMENCIESTLSTASESRESLMSQVFYVVHANVYCYWGQQQIFIPCEVAISRFSLKEGVIATYHVFPAPCTPTGDIPLGYKFSVRQNSEAVHGIPEPSVFTKIEYDYKKIRSDVHHFLRPNGGDEIPPLYTMDMNETNNNCHISAVRSFFDNVASDSYDKFRVYSLTRLFFKLNVACQRVAEREFSDHERAFPVEGIAHQQLLKDVYNFCSGLACEFHEDGDHYHNCSASFVKRWVFLICEFCCTALRIELIPGRHCVATAQISITWASEKPSSSKSVDINEDNGGWSTVQKVEHGGMKKGGRAKTTADRLQEGIRSLKISSELQEELIVKPPQQTRTFKMGQSPHVVSEIKEDSPLPSVRLPTSRGRGEMLTRALSMQSPGAQFSSDDFPAIGAVARPGQVSKPSASGWGRGFMM